MLNYLELTRDDPGNIEYRAGLLRAKIQASLAHFELAKKYQEAGQLERALVELQEAVQLDPTNQYAQVELDKVREQLKAKRDQYDYATSLDTLKERNRGALAQPPVLDPRSDEPIDLDFPEPVSVMDIYRALGKAFGINVLFDPRLRDQEIAIELKQVTAQDALEILMRASGHFYKVVDAHSIIIAADTPQNRRAYEDLMIQTFFLSNSEVRDVMTMLRSLVDARKIAANERLERDRPARHRRPREGGGEADRGQRQGALRGGGRRRADADQLLQAARARGVDGPLPDRLHARRRAGGRRRRRRRRRRPAVGLRRSGSPISSSSTRRAGW